MSAIQSIVSLLVPGPGYIYTAANEFFIVNGEPSSPQPQPPHRKETFIDQKSKKFDKNAWDLFRIMIIFRSCPNGKIECTF